MKIMQVLDHATFGDRCIKIAKECEPYCDIIWFRIKDKNIIRQEAEKLRKALPQAFLSLSLDAEIANELGYNAVQLGADSDVESVRKKFPNLKMGYSAHCIDEVKFVDADYFTLSPIFHTVKGYEVKPLGVVDISELDKEVFALGGISLKNVDQLKGKGFSGVAGISFYKELSAFRGLSL